MTSTMKSDPLRPPVSTSTTGVSAAGGGVAPCPAPAWAPSIVGAVTAAAPAEAARFMNCLRSTGCVFSIFVPPADRPPSPLRGFGETGWSAPQNTLLVQCRGRPGQQDDTRKPRAYDPGCKLAFRD